jgi:hypothetical protein
MNTLRKAAFAALAAALLAPAAALAQEVTLRMVSAISEKSK